MKLKQLFDRYSEDDVIRILASHFLVYDVNADSEIDMELAKLLEDEMYNPNNFMEGCGIEENSDDDYLWDDSDEDDFDEDDFDDEEYEEIPECPDISELPYTNGSLLCPHCHSIGDTYVDGTAYCHECKTWYCYA